MENEIINANAEYIALYKDNHTILVDMYDIDDILPIQEVVFNGTDKRIMLYSVMFKDHSFWQIPIEEEVLNNFKNFKKGVDKEK